jgi:hypothetical protein
MTQTGDRLLWRLVAGSSEPAFIDCLMVSCCAGAELQIHRTDATAASAVVLRELYPTKSDLYERARMLEREYASSGFTRADLAAGDDGL